MEMEGQGMKKDVTGRYTVERLFVGARTAEEVVADLLRAHAL